MNVIDVLRTFCGLNEDQGRDNMTMRNRVQPGIPFEPLAPWCGRHAGRRSNAVSACPSASARAGRSRLGDQIGQRLRPCPPVRGQQHLPDQGNGPVDLDRTVYDLDRGAPGLGPPVRAPSPGSGMRSSTTSTPDLVPGQGELTLTELRPAWLPRFGCFGQTRPIGRVIAAKKAAKSAAKSAAHHAAKTTASGSKLAAVGGAKAPRRKAASAKAAPTTLRHLSRVGAQRALPLAA